MKNKIKSIVSILISAGFLKTKCPEILIPLVAEKIAKIGGCDISEGQKEQLELVGIDSAKALLEKKGILRAVNSAFDKINLDCMSVPEIMQVEEEIKQLNRDMSGEANGQHYTPEDIETLLTCIAKELAPKKDSISVYDPTCGGGNLLYNTSKVIDNVTSVCGQEYDEQLAAFASIGFSVNPIFEIKQGNTLTDDKFSDRKFDIVQSNPPYGTSWAGFSKEIIESNRFEFLPKKADAQLLFVQHIVNKLSEDGIATVVLNGSLMFSGDVNSGESQCRKWLLDNNLISHWIQLPKDEFYNTSITTYIWVIQKNRVSEDITLINAQNWKTPLKKSQGSKRNNLSEEGIEIILNAIKGDSKECEEIKTLSKYDFYYNKQLVELKKDKEIYECEIIENNKADKPKKIKEFDNDYEIIPYCNQNNEKAISDFITKWVRREYILKSNSIGVEVNFNKIFYKPVVLRSTKEIAADIKALDAELAALEGELWG